MKQILIVGAAWIGDMIMGQVLFKLLKQQMPQAQIDVLAPAWTQPLLQRMPEVRAAHPMPIGHGKLLLKERYRLGRVLSRIGYDQAILLPNSLKSSLIPFFAGIPLRTGWRGEMRYGFLNDVRVLDEQLYPKMIDRFAALALPAQAPLPASLPWPELVIDAEQVQQTRRDFGLNDGSRPILALCPGAEFGPAKRWPVAHFATVARHFLERGWQIWLFGSDKDRDIAEAIVELAPGSQNLAGKTQLAQAIDLLSEARLVLTNDSGLMHVAASLARPLIALYGSTSPSFTPPLAESAQILRLNLACSPCFQRECPLGHLDCLTQLQPAQVIEACQQRSQA